MNIESTLDIVLWIIVVFMFVPVDRLITTSIVFLGMLILLLFLRIFHFAAIIQLLLSQLVRCPIVVPIVRIILNLRLRIIVMTFTNWRLVMVVVSVMLFNNLLLNILWLLLLVELVTVMPVVVAMATVTAVAVFITIDIKVAFIFVVFDLVMMDVVILVFNWLHLPVVVNVTLRCFPIGHFLNESMLDWRCLISIIVLLMLIIVTIMVFVMAPFVSHILRVIDFMVIIAMATIIILMEKVTLVMRMVIVGV